MIVVVMGVAGCGKTTVGKGLAERLGGTFLDADDFHSAESIEKMRQGIALRDEDRWPWLDRLNVSLRQAEGRAQSVVLACSALRQRYRDRIADDLATLRWIHLKGDFDLILRRLETRRGHYMKAGMLRSQFETLEPPRDALELDITLEPAALIAQAHRWLIPGTSSSSQ